MWLRLETSAIIWLVFLSHTILTASSTSDVVSATDSTIDQILDGSKHVFIKFYAPWCGHCKHIVEPWNKLASAFAEEDDVVIAEVDATTETKTAKKYDIKGYPTLLFFKKGSDKPETYNAARALPAMTSYVNKQSNTYRKPDGSIDTSFGIVPELETILKESSCLGKEKLECLDRIEASLKSAVAALSVSHTTDYPTSETQLLKKCRAYYSSFLQHLKTNSAFIDTEIKRLETLHKFADINTEAKQFAFARKNILESIRSHMQEKLSQIEKNNEL